MPKKLRVDEAAAAAGVGPKTWTSYVTRGQAPPADGHFDGRTPWWYDTTVHSWDTDRKAASTPSPQWTAADLAVALDRRLTAAQAAEQLGRTRYAVEKVRHRRRQDD